MKSKFLTPINGISKLTKLFFATLFSAPLRGRKTQKITSNLLKVSITLLVAVFLGLAVGCGSGGSDVTSSSGSTSTTSGSTTGGTLTGSGQ